MIDWQEYDEQATNLPASFSRVLEKFKPNIKPFNNHVTIENQWDDISE